MTPLEYQILLFIDRHRPQPGLTAHCNKAFLIGRFRHQCRDEEVQQKLAALVSQGLVIEGHNAIKGRSRHLTLSDRGREAITPRAVG